MKKTILFITLYAICLPLFSQNEYKTIFSVAASVGAYHWTTTSNDIQDNGFAGGLLLSAYPSPKLKLSTGISYAIENDKYEYTDAIVVSSSQTVNMRYLHIPILASFRLYNKPHYSFSLFGGVVLKHLSTYHVKGWNTWLSSGMVTPIDSHKKIETNNLQIAFSLGLTYSYRLGKPFMFNINPYVHIPKAYNKAIVKTQHKSHDDDWVINKTDLGIRLGPEYKFARK